MVALFRAIEVIKSCTTEAQLVVAKRYYELAIKRASYGVAESHNMLRAFDDMRNTKSRIIELHNL